MLRKLEHQRSNTGTTKDHKTRKLVNDACGCITEPVNTTGVEEKDKCSFVKQREEKDDGTVCTKDVITPEALGPNARAEYVVFEREAREYQSIIHFLTRVIYTIHP